MPNVAILGLGMMGGSLGLALRAAKSFRTIGVGRDPARMKKARALGICDEAGTRPEEAVRGADIAVVCTTVEQIVPTVRKILPHLKRGAVITDIGSVKSALVRELSRSSAAVPFVGGHPMAGSEKTGFENARADLYRGATVVLTPAGASSAQIRAVESLWKAAGARTLTLEPEVHDILVAQTSHLPHVLAGALAQLVARLQKRDAHAADVLAGSFRDMTRIAESDPQQWAEICAYNQKFVIGALKSYQDILRQLVRRLDGASDPAAVWREFFSEGRRGKERLSATQAKGKAR